MSYNVINNCKSDFINNYYLLIIIETCNLSIKKKINSIKNKQVLKIICLEFTHLLIDVKIITKWKIINK